MTTRMCADQHKCLPHLACLNPTPLLFKKVYLVIQKMIPKLEKNFPLVCRDCQDESIDI